jgi:hypothetical protein
MMEEEMKGMAAQKEAVAAVAATAAQAARERQRTSIVTPGSARPGTSSRRKFGL